MLYRQIKPMWLSLSHDGLRAFYYEFGRLVWIWQVILPKSIPFVPGPTPNVDFFKNHKAFMPFSVSSSHLVPCLPTLIPPHTSLISQPLLVFSVPLLAFSHLLSLRLETKASSHSAKFMISLPSLEAKGTSRPVFPLFPVFGLSGAHLCMGGHGMLHRTHRFLTALPFTEARSPRYPPRTAFC